MDTDDGSDADSRDGSNADSRDESTVDAPDDSDVTTYGFLAPASEADARERFDALGPAAQTVVKEIAKAMAFDAEEYDERVTGEVVETARDAVFASLLEVRAGPREAYEAWLADRDREVVERGSEHVSRVAWHDAFGETVVAATYENEERAAVATLRRQAYGRVYRDVV